MAKDIFTLKKDGVKRHQRIFNFQSSIFNSGLSGLGACIKKRSNSRTFFWSPHWPQSLGFGCYHKISIRAKCVKILPGCSNYTGCHKYVPFARSPNRRKCSVLRIEIITNMTTAILESLYQTYWRLSTTRRRPKNHRYRKVILTNALKSYFWDGF